MIRSICCLGMMIFLLSTTTLRAYSQQNPSTVSTGFHLNTAQSETDIAAIRTAYTKINQMALKAEAFKFESPGCVEDGLITYMKSDGNIVKITYSGGIGDGSWTTESYFSGGKVVFYFDRLTGGAADQKMSTTEYRLYVKNDKPIRCMISKNIVQSDSKAGECIHTAYQLLKAYQTKKFAAALCDE